MASHILAIDQGTTSSRAIIFNSSLEIIASAQEEFEQFFPQSGWVEHDPNEIWGTTLSTCKKALDTSGLSATDIASIGITNQRETTILWDKTTGKAIHKAIVWQDRRTSSYCAELSEAGHDEMITSKTGLLLDSYFSGTKIKWLLDNVEGARDRAKAGELLFGTVDTFILWHLTGGKSHATDATNASRTMLFNIHDNCWDKELLELLNIPESLLPEVLDCSADFGKTDPEILGAPIQVGGIAGDQQAALVGQACFQPGMIKSTYGTGCFALMNIGETFQVSQNRLLTTPAYRISGKTSYAIEGSIFMAGATVQWLRDALNIIENASETEALAQSLNSNEGVYLVPAFTGLGAPYWQPEVKAAIFGLTRGSGKAHIARAALEAQAYQTYDLFNAMRNDTGIDPSCLRVDGGLVANKFVCQFLADITNCSIEVPQNTETTALGAAFLAGLSAGIYQGLDDIVSIWQLDKSYSPDMDRSVSTHLIEQWSGYVQRLI